MTSSRANKPDTPADEKLRECLIQPEKRNFVMIAGAGSGKTTSLIKALATIISAHGNSLQLHRQRVACITYTEIAAQEIWADVGSHTLVHVSTIHSFFWAITKSFQSDIRTWVLRRIDERIGELEAESAGYGPRVRQRTRDKNQRDIERYKASRQQVASVGRFSYGTGSDYPKGILGHDDVIRVGTTFLRERPLFRTLLAQQFPFVFVDESQDTQDIVVEAFKAVAIEAGNKFCLGFFGDPMQKIYAAGIGSVPVEEGWLIIEKEENFRCPTSVLDVANAIRRDGDGLVQVGGRNTEVDGTGMPVVGTARIFILPIDENRMERLDLVRKFIARENNDPAWISDDPGDVKILVIVHRMAAARLNFESLYAAMNDKAPDSFKEGFLDASAWPLRPFDRFVMPLAEATASGNEFEAMSILRKQCPRLDRNSLDGGVNVAAVLESLRTAAQKITEMVENASGSTVRDVLILLRDMEMIELDPRILAYLNDQQPGTDEAGSEVAEEDSLSKEISSMDRFLACPVSEFKGYRQYLAQLSPFSTQQGIKGAEFSRVLAVLDDDEGTHVQFSYDKFFGVKELSDRDLANIAEGRETSVERTRRLFYVCCTRALSDLAVVYFSANCPLAEQKVRESGYFPEASIHTLSDIA